MQRFSSISDEYSGYQLLSSGSLEVHLPIKKEKIQLIAQIIAQYPGGKKNKAHVNKAWTCMADIRNYWNQNGKMCKASYTNTQATCQKTCILGVDPSEFQPHYLKLQDHWILQYSALSKINKQINNFFFAPLEK